MSPQVHQQASKLSRLPIEDPVARIVLPQLPA